MSKKMILRKAFAASLPVMAGYLVLGTAFGILMSASGFAPVYTGGMSLLVYAGSLQFAAVGLLTGGASLVTCALTGFSVNARHIVYGLSMAEKYSRAGRIRPYLIFALTDETFSLVSADTPELGTEDSLSYCLYVTVLDHIYWVTGSVIGAVAGTLLPFSPDGLEFALTALFLTLLIDRLRDGKKRYYACLAGVLVPLVCLLLFGKDVFLIPALILMLVALAFGKEEAAV